jgi:hypothetical protein
MVRVCLGFTDISDLVASHIRVERAAEKLEPVRELARVRVIENTFDDGLVEPARRVGT